MDKIEPQEIVERNRVLEEIGKSVFDGRASLRIVEPASVQLSRLNARFMKRDVFNQLVSNIRSDGRLSSVPLCVEDGGDLVVLSGNHRIKAAREAGLRWVLVMIITEELTPGKQIAVQLSHNALNGEDDKDILAQLWAAVDDIQDRLYAGLSSDDVGELEKIELVQFTTPSLATKTVTFAFSQEEAELVEQVLGELGAHGAASAIYLSRFSQFDEFFDALQAVKKREQIKNASLAMARLVEIVKDVMDREGEE